ncbi:MAG: hypothetical protein ACQEVA_02685 [Myxococcota bacterium]
MRRLIEACLALSLILWAIDARAQSWDPIPDLREGERAAVKDSLDGPQYDGMRRCLEDFDSQAGAEYYAVVVDITNKFGRPTPRVHHTVEYVDAAYQAYKPSGQLDPETHVLIALGVTNRGVAIHPGTDWVHLGFETAAIKRTIDDSEFATYARGGDYGEAVCALARAVDSRLAELLRDKKRREQMLARRVADAGDRTDEVVESARETAGEDAILTHEIEGQMPSVRNNVDDAERALQRGWISKAESAVATAEQQMASMRERISNYDQARERLAQLAERAEALGVQIADHPDSDGSSAQEAKTSLASCQTQIDEATDTLGSGQVPHNASYSITQCLGRVESELETADRIHLFKTRILPAIIGTVLLVLLVIFVVGRLRRHRNLMEKLDKTVESWSRKLARASERLMELESEYPFYFDSSRPAWEGDSAELDQDCANAVNRAFLLYSEATSLLSDAESLIADAGPLSVSPLERAWALLNTREIEFSTGEIEQRRRIFLPLTREYRGTADQMLDDLDEAYKDASRLLDSVSDLVNDLDQQTQSGTEKIKRLEAATQERAGLGYPCEHLEDAASPLADEHHALLDLARTDPIAAVGQRRELTPKLAALADRAELGNTCIGRLEGRLLERAGKASDEISRLRDAGYAVSEPGFDPDRTIERLRREANEALDLIRHGREREASRLTEAIAGGLAELEKQLETTEQARDQIPVDLERLEKERRALEKRLPSAREVLQTLESEHAEKAFERESDNLDQLSTVLGRLESWQESVSDSHRAQHYLTATADLETAFDLVSKGNRLVTEIHDAEQRLEAARDQAAQMRSNIEDMLAQTGALLDEDQPGISRENRERFEGIESRANGVFSKMDADRPHWLELQDDAAELESLAESQRDRIRRDIEHYRAAQSLYADLEDRHEDLARRVRAETRDRAFVKGAVDKVRSQLNEWKGQLDAASTGGTALLRHGKSVHKALDWARSVWTSELELIRQVESKRETVADRISREHDRSLGYGVYVDCSDALRAVNDAEEAMRARDHERALSLLQNANHRVETELDMAQHRYDTERQEALARRRRRRSSSSSFSSSSSSFSSSSSSFGSSFSGGSSFSSSSSGGSSFGGTSSGGSSW